MALDFVQGAALMLALCWLLSISSRYWKGRYLPTQVTSGLLFGGICVIGMLTPVVLPPGVLIDSRTDVIALATLFGGPLVGGIALGITGVVRWRLGGAGMWIGLVALVPPFLLGLAFRRAVAIGRLKRGTVEFLVLGLGLHAVGLLLFMTVQPSIGLPALHVTLFFLGVMPIVTVLLGLLLKDVEERTAMIQTSLQSESRLRAIAKAVPDMLLVIDEDGRYLEVVSPQQTPLYSDLPEQPALVGRRMADVLPTEYAELFIGLVQRALRTNGPQSLEYAMPGPAGVQTFEVRANRLERIPGGKPAVVMVTRDISQRRVAEEHIRTLALYDPLTSLPNRNFFLGQMPMARRESARSRRFAAVLSIDLDDFGSINDTHGILVGDRMLQRVALCLGSMLPLGATLARWGADEFVVLLEGLSEQEEEAAADAARMGQKAVAAIALTAEDDVVSHSASASVGIALFRDLNAGDNPLRRADLALHAAKAAGRSQVRIYDPVFQDAVTARLALEAAIRHGLVHDEFIVHYQPQLNSAGATTGVEALVRWQHPERGLLYPVDFLAAAERAGLMYQLDTQVLTKACLQLTRWAADPVLQPLIISVNISAFQMSRAAFADEVMGVLQTTGANARRLKLELTETALVNDMSLATLHMVTLREQGVSFALDDFGTGYSSMSYLQRLPLDQLKIDQSFVRGLPFDKGSLAIVRAIVALAANFEFEVLAEGVETQAQRDVLEACGCHQFQGYLFSRAVPLADLERALKAAGSAA